MAHKKTNYEVRFWASHRPQKPLNLSLNQQHGKKILIVQEKKIKVFEFRQVFLFLQQEKTAEYTLNSFSKWVIPSLF